MSEDTIELIMMCGHMQHHEATKLGHPSDFGQFNGFDGFSSR
jgi:hypothetical protein